MNSGVDRPLDGHGGDDRSHDGRYRGHQRKQGDKAAVQPRARPCRPSSSPQSGELDPDQDDEDDDDKAVAEQKHFYDVGRWKNGSKPGEDEKRRERQQKGGADHEKPQSAGETAVIKGRRLARASGRLNPRQTPNRTSATTTPRSNRDGAMLVAILQRCCQITTFWRRRQRKLGIPRRFRSRIFLRSVLRLSPRISAALIWFPRVMASVAAIRGASRSCNTR